MHQEQYVRAFLGQLTIGVGNGTQAAKLHEEYQRRARVHGWAPLTATAFGRLITAQLRELGFEKRKHSAIAVYHGVAIPELSAIATVKAA